MVAAPALPDAPRQGNEQMPCKKLRFVSEAMNCSAVSHPTQKYHLGTIRLYLHTSNNLALSNERQQLLPCMPVVVLKCIKRSIQQFACLACTAK